MYAYAAWGGLEGEGWKRAGGWGLANEAGSGLESTNRRRLLLFKFNYPAWNRPPRPAASLTVMSMSETDDDYHDGGYPVVASLGGDDKDMPQSKKRKIQRACDVCRRKKVSNLSSSPCASTPRPFGPRACSAGAGWPPCAAALHVRSPFRAPVSLPAWAWASRAAGRVASAAIPRPLAVALGVGRGRKSTRAQEQEQADS